jgi:erythronate-4-phosphate dehydrogenase
MSLNIVADENMPLVEETFGQHGSITRLPGRGMRREDLLKADVLLVRSVTKVNEALLHDTPIKFVGTATIGTDHLDMTYMDQVGITHSSAPGCNADSVAEYVVSCLASLVLEGRVQLDQLSAGIIGAGNVGSRVAQRLEWLGIPQLIHDPPRAERESSFESQDLEKLKSCSLICQHAPLTKEGAHPSHHLLDADFLSSLADGTVIISAGRGPVIDFEALKPHLDRLICCLDVWEPEPDVSAEHLKKSHFASPHVAGYSLQSKWRGTTMLYDTFCQHQGLEHCSVQDPMSAPLIELKANSWATAVHQLYDPTNDTKRMREALAECDDVSKAFDTLRKTYPLRHEFSFPNFKGCELPTKDRELLTKLGFRFVD